MALSINELVSSEIFHMSSESYGSVNDIAEHLRRRMNRRLVKLAKWADIPTEERTPKANLSMLRTTIPTTASMYAPGNMCSKTCVSDC
jgi:hypothetical protein